MRERCVRVVGEGGVGVVGEGEVCEGDWGRGGV